MAKRQVLTSGGARPTTPPQIDANTVLEYRRETERLFFAKRS
jgi:hypothetical protein